MNQDTSINHETKAMPYDAMLECVSSYISKHPEQDVYLIDKIFGDGNQLFWLHFENQFKSHNQMFLVRLDSNDIENCHDRMEEVVKYLNSDGELFFMDNEYEDYISEEIYDGKTPLSYSEWEKSQFPKADLSWGNYYWGAVNAL
jgi:hypothetical protein